jgi:hypothetical protein
MIMSLFHFKTDDNGNIIGEPVSGFIDKVSGQIPPNTNLYLSRWGIGDRCIVDDDRSLIATVVGVTFYPNHYVMVRIAYIHHNGANHEYDVDDMRLTPLVVKHISDIKRREPTASFGDDPSQSTEHITSEIERVNASFADKNGLSEDGKDG